MQITLGAADLTDLEACADLLIDSWQDHFRFLPDDVLAQLHAGRIRANFERTIHRGGRYVKATCDGRIVGFGSFGGCVHRQIPCEHEIYELYVATEAQGNGIGSSLLRAIEAEVARGVIGLGTLEQNPCRRFYDKHGFDEVARETTAVFGWQGTSLIYCKSVRGQGAI